MPIERWRHQPVQIRSNGDAHGNLVGVSRYDNTGGGRYEKGDIHKQGTKPKDEKAW